MSRRRATSSSFVIPVAKLIIFTGFPAVWIILNLNMDNAGFLLIRSTRAAAIGRKGAFYGIDKK